MPGQPPPFSLTGQLMPGSGTQWDLPRRTWGAGWYMPFIFIAVGIFVAALFGINGPVTLPNFNADPAAAVFDLVWLIAQAIPTLLGCFIVLVGLVLRYGRTAVTMRNQEITTTDRFFLLRWTRRINTERITGFEINVGTSSTNGGPKVPMENVSVLIANTDQTGKSAVFVVAWGYPKTWMQQLVDELGINPQLADLEVTTTFGSDKDDPEQREPKVEQPSDTKALLTFQDHGLTIDIPPTGWLRGSKGIGFFSILWNGFIIVFISVMVLSMINGSFTTSSNASPLFMLLFMIPFVAVGIFLGAFAAHLGKSRSSLVVIGSGPEAVLAFHRVSPVRKPRELSWTSEQLSHIRVGDSNMSVNDQPIQELQIHPKRGKAVGLLKQLDDEELEWIAYELRQQLGLSRNAIAIDHD
ncbi:MAG: hypothetical protein AB8C95_08090 [Phycisphaeraceae bacterium]